MKQHESIFKDMRFMKKQLKRTAALAVILIAILSLSGCEKLSETYADAETQSTEQTVGEALAFGNQEEPGSAIDFEITDWTMEDLVTDMEVEGYKFSLPCTVSDISKKCEVKYTAFIEESQVTGGSLYLGQKYIALIYFDGNVDKEISTSNICRFFMGEYGQDFNDGFVKSVELPKFNIMGITNESSRDDLINILGNPNMRAGESDRHFQYGFSENEFIIIDFDKENPDKIERFFIIYNTEE